jgi:hypothetical protein
MSEEAPAIVGIAALAPSTALTRLGWHAGGVACLVARSTLIPKVMPRCTPRTA